MSNNETQADIAREMRTYFQTQKRNGNPEHKPWHQVLSDWADRIEAAAEREIRAERTEAIDEALAHAEEVRQAKCRNCERAPGNAAAMREALTQVQIGFDGNVLGPIGDVPNDWEMAEAKRLCKVVDSALAAPPRNCDRFGSYEDALEYWREQVECAEDNGSFDVWLMAHAEGGAEC